MVHLFIPQPRELHQFVTTVANRNGDKTRKAITAEYKDWMKGHTSMPHEVTWRYGVQDGIVSEYEVLLRAGYSLADGPWGKLVFLVYLSSAETRWQIVQQIETIGDRIEARGVPTALSFEDSSGYYLRIGSATSVGIRFCVGEKTPDPYEMRLGIRLGDTPLILEPEPHALSLSEAECVAQLSALEQGIPRAIDAIYEISADMPRRIPW